MYLKRFNRYNCGCKPSTSAAHVQEHAHARDFMTMSGKVGARSRARKRRTHKHTRTAETVRARARVAAVGASATNGGAGAADGGARAADDGASAVADGARAVASFVVDGDHPPPPPQPPVSIPSHKIVFDPVVAMPAQQWKVNDIMPT